MKKNTLLRALALWMCLILSGAAALAEAPLADDAADDAPIVEQPEIALPADDVAEAEPAPVNEPAPAENPAPVDEPAPAENPAPVEDGPTSVAAPEAVEDAQPPAEPALDPGTCVFAQTASIESDTWSNVNLVRADGFSGALALVDGQLTLVNVTIDGRPAREADLAACFALGSNGTIVIQDDAPLSLNLSAFCVNKGGKVALSARFNGADVPAKKVKWATSDKKVAKVSKGKVTAKGAGTALITAAYEGATASCLVVATNHKPVKGLKLSAKKLTLAPYDARQLGLTISPADAYNPGITWTSSDPAVASVDENGWVTGLSGGVATITVASGNGKKKSCKVTVKGDSSGGAAATDPGSPMPGSGPFEITFMNIGRNDGILIHCGGEWAFVDSGKYKQGIAAVNFMRAQGVDRLKYYIATHAHKDHIGGAPYILANMPVEQVVIPHGGTAAQIQSCASNKNEKAVTRAANYRVVVVGEHFCLGDADFLVLGPIKPYKADIKTTDENDNSLIVRVTYGSNTFLLTGDATVSEYRQVEEYSPGCLRAEVFKNAHHYGWCQFAIDHVLPRIVVFSTGSKYLPKEKFLEYLRAMGCEIYITSDNCHGHVKFVSDGAALSVFTQFQPS